MALPSSPARKEAPLPFTSALLLTDRESNAAADRMALRGAGLTRVRIALSGAEAARQLAERAARVLMPETELIICLPTLADMKAQQFAELVRSHPLLPHIPLMAITPEHGREAALRQSGFNVVLLRPFTTTALINQMHTAAREAKGARDQLLAWLSGQHGIPSHEAFDQALRAYLPPERDAMSGEDALRQGLLLLRDHRWDEALPFLQKSADEGTRQGEANAALAAFWQASGESAKAAACLRDAFHRYAERDDWDNANKTARRMALEYPDAPSPVVKELERRSRQGQAAAVAELARIAQDVLTEESVRDALLKGCSVNPQALPDILAELEKSGKTSLCRALAPEAAPEAPRRKGWFRREAAPRQEKRKGIALAPTPDELRAEAAASAMRPTTAEAAAKPAPGGETAAKPAGSASVSPGDSGDFGTGRSGLAIAPLGQNGDGPGSSLLGDTGAVIRATLRFSRAKK